MIITGGKHRGRKILVPDEKITRPTLSKVRQGVFNVLYSLLGEFEELSFLDVFGGSGVMGLEAISRGFKKVVVFEKNPKAVQIIKKNYSSLGLDLNLKMGDSLKLIKKIEDKFDVIYIDPPYFSGIYEKIFKTLPPAKIIIAEHSESIKIEDYTLICEKNYGGKRISFFSQQ